MRVVINFTKEFENEYGLTLKDLEKYQYDKKQKIKEHNKMYYEKNKERLKQHAKENYQKRKQLN